MNPYAIIAALVLAIALTGGGYAKGWHDRDAGAVEEQRDGLLAYAERIKEALDDDEKNKAVIAGLHVERDKLRNTVQFPTCTAGDSDEANRLLSSRMDELFAGFQERTGRLIEEADDLNRQAIRANALR